MNIPSTVSFSNFPYPPSTSSLTKSTLPQSNVANEIQESTSLSFSAGHSSMVTFREKASRYKGVYRCGRKWKAQVGLIINHQIHSQ
jgi:hypothetical protein